MISIFLDMYGEWSETEVELFRFLLPPNGVCIEVGSNIGGHAVPLSKICAEGRIYCFEPQRALFHVLCGNLAINNCLNVTARHQAVGSMASVVQIEASDYSASWNYGSFSLSKGFSSEAEYTDSVWREAVQVISLDTDPEVSSLSRIDFIKLDAEGCETEILKGAGQIISKHRPDLFVEAGDAKSVDAIIGTLSQIGYTGQWFVSHRFRRDNFNRTRIKVDGFDRNILFRHQSRSHQPLALPQASASSDINGGIPILSAFRAC
ncbi:MAG: FkbM family methyltransferase [Pseudomonadota bacterium]